MDLLEYQGKQLFREAGLPTPWDALAKTPEEARRLVAGRKHVVLKAQIPVGHRGKTGGVLKATTAEVEEKAKHLLSATIQGHRVEAILLEEFVDLAREIYLALIVDRLDRAITVLLSIEGGIDVEEITEHGGLHRIPIEKFSEQLPALTKDLPQKTHVQMLKIVSQLHKMMIEKDATLVEVNPLALLQNGSLTLLDSKITIDDNALYRQKEIAAWRTPLHGVEKSAEESGVAFVPLQGDVAIIGNGAGLVMATLDMLTQFGGHPANFLDVGGGARSDKMEQAVDIVLSQKNVRGLLINIFGGITRTDEIANGLVAFTKKKSITVPIVVRLIGNRDREGSAILKEAGIDTYREMEQAVKAIVRKISS